MSAGIRVIVDSKPVDPFIPVVDTLVRRARHAGWKVDAAGYYSTHNSRVVFSINTRKLGMIVFYTPAQRRFFGILKNGILFNSDDKHFVSEPWFSEIFNFFMEV